MDMSEQTSYILIVLAAILIIVYTVFFIAYSFRKQRDLTQSFWKKDISKVFFGVCLFFLSLYSIFVTSFGLSSFTSDTFYLDTIMWCLISGVLIFFTVNLFFGGLIDIIVRLYKK